MYLRINNKSVLKFLEGVIGLLYRCFYLFIQWCVVGKNKNPEPRKYYFSICAIFKDEAKFLQEWVEYHRMLGVDHIYLYNNNSTDNYLDVLRRYMEEDFVSLVDWEENFAQCEAYKHCCDNVRKENFWLAFIDIDEFIVPHKATDIKCFLRSYEDFPVVTLYWKMFGTGGLVCRDESKLLIEQFTVSWPKLDGTGKCILNMNECFEFHSVGVHRTTAHVKLGNFSIKVPPITEWRRFIIFPQIYESPKKNTIQLNHYWSKAFDDYVYKISKGDVARAENLIIRSKKEFFYLHEINNTSEDKVIFRFLMRLKIRMFGLDKRFF